MSALSATSVRKSCLPALPNNTVPTVRVPLSHACSIIYKALGPDTETNGTLTPALQAQLDGLSLEEVVAQVKSTGGSAFSTGSSAYRGVSWNKGTERWLTQFKPADGRRLRKSFDTELEAAQQYDRWCQQYGRCVISVPLHAVRS